MIAPRETDILQVRESRMHRHTGIMLVLAMILGHALAHAQPPYPSQRLPQASGVPGVPPLLERVDPLYGDSSPLSESLRDVEMQIDLRSPVGFQNVYRVPGRDDLLMRQSGGVYAIFPQSVYVPVRGGSAATVPPGTVFSIGPPGEWSMPSPWVRAPSLARMDASGATLSVEHAQRAQQIWTGATPVDRRWHERRGTLSDPTQWTGADDVLLHQSPTGGADTRPEVRRAPPPEPATFLTTIVTDDAYRASRLAELLDRAVRAAHRAQDR